MTEKEPSILNNTSDGVWICDFKGKILKVNDTYCQMSGYTRNELIGLFISKILVLNTSVKHVDYIKKITENGGYYRFESSHCCKDGSISEVDITSFYLNQKEKKIATIIRDISKKMQIDTRILESESRFRMASLAAQLGVFEWDVKKDIFFWENERMYEIFGCLHENGPINLQLFLSQYIEPDDKDVFNCRFTYSIQSGNPFNIICRIKRKNDGQLRWIKMSSQSFCTSNGDNLCFTGIVEDITERKISEIKFYKTHIETVLTNRILYLFMEENGDCRFERVLEAALNQTGSMIGLFGYLHEEGYITYVLRLDLQKDSASKRMIISSGQWNQNWSQMLRKKSSYILSESERLPPGHPPIKSAIITPIRFQGLTIGFLNQANKTGEYTDDDIELFDNIANRIAPLLYTLIQEEIREKELLRAENEQDKILRRFGLLAWIAGELLHTKQPKKIVKRLCTKVMEYLNCDFFLNYLTSEDDGLYLNAYSGITEEDAENIKLLHFSDPINKSVINGKNPIVSQHVSMNYVKRDWLNKSVGIKAYTCNPLFGAGGKIIGILSFGSKGCDKFDDDHYLMKAVANQISVALMKMYSEQELQYSKRDLNRAQAVSNTGSWKLDVKRDILTWSDETFRMFGIADGTILTLQKFLSCVHPDDREYVNKKWNDSKENGTKYDIQHRIIANGEIKWVRETAEMEFDKNGNLYSAFGTVQDITKQKHDEEELVKYRDGLEKLVELRTAELCKSQEQLIHAQKMEALGLLAGGIAHDFNNMIQVITGFSYRALRSQNIPNLLRDNLERINEAAWSAAALTHRLLAFSRKQVLQPRVFTINNLVSKMKPILRHSLGENIAFVCKLQKKISNIKTDPVQLEQVIMNIVLNARNAMPNGGTLSLFTNNVTLGEEHPYTTDSLPPGPYVMLSISDTGSGMSKEIMERIFEPFFTTRPFGAGSGLGLSTAYGIIRQSAGVIRVYSQVGLGSTFKIYLPQSLEPVNIDVVKTTGVSYTDKCDETILVIEDNDISRELICLELQDQGYHVLQANNSSSAIKVSQQYNGEIHLLLTDVVLPGTNGWELSKTLSETRPEMVTLYISGYDQDQIIKEGKLRAGANFLAKPFSPDQLSSSIREILRSRANLRLNTNLKVEKHLNPSGLLNTKRILIIDDLPEVSNAIAMIIRKPQLEIKTAEDGETALQIANEFKPDLVMLDIKLPDIDGLELARKFKKQDSWPAPYIIVVSGYYINETENKELIDAYLPKPVDFRQLEKLISSSYLVV